MLIRFVFSLLVALVVSGCATQAGFELARDRKALEPEEPWQASTLWGIDIAAQECVSVIDIPLPRPFPTVLGWEQNDHRRSFTTAGGDERILRRHVWPAVAFDSISGNPVASYNAVLNERRTAFRVIVPACGEELAALLDQQLLIVSADACFVMTTHQAFVPLPEYGRLPENFFGRYPSPINPEKVSRMGRDTETGREFLGQLGETYSARVWGTHSARPEVLDISTLTSQKEGLDRFVSNGSAMIPFGGFTLIGLAEMAHENKDVFKGFCPDVHAQLKGKE